MSPTSPTRRRLLRASAAGGLAGLLGLQAPAARACEFFTPNLRVKHPWARATAAGETSALVSMEIDQVLQDDRLLGISTPLATGAELGWAGQPPGLHVALPAGQDTHFNDTQALLRLTGLTQPLELTCAYPLRLHFARGGALDALLSIDFPVPMPGARRFTL